MTESRASTDPSYDCVATSRQQAGSPAAAHGHDHGHAHSHAGDDHGHDHAHGQAFDRGAQVHQREGANARVTGALRAALIMTSVFMVAEVVGGVVSNSLALLADAGHMLTDVGALAFSLFVAWLARQPATPKRTYGYLRFEILAALLNGATLLAVSAWIIWEAIGRLRNPEVVETGVMFFVALAGLIVNIISARMLHGSADHSLNVRGAYLHVLSDLLGSVAAIVAAILARYLGWSLADPVASILMTALIVRGSWKLVRESVDILLDPLSYRCVRRPAETRIDRGRRIGARPARLDAHVRRRGDERPRRGAGSRRAPEGPRGHDGAGRRDGHQSHDDTAGKEGTRRLPAGARYDVVFLHPASRLKHLA
jgi:cobalt-zinc-cadmium efflux system protein